MALIVIRNLYEKSISTQDFSKTLLKHIQDAGIDWMHACGGKGRCTTCKAIVVRGSENMNPRTDVEIRYANRGELGTNERLVCQVEIQGDVVIEVPESGKMPHMQYSGE